jgi:hypothetical protein
VRAEAAPAAESSKNTPVDMTMWAAAPEPVVERQVVNGSSFIVNRRPVLDPAALGARRAVAVATAGDGDDASPLDVPAFLRRHES